MPQTLEALTRRSDTLTSIRGIVHTMKTLSAINAAPYEHAAQAVEAYHQTVIQGFSAFAYRTGEIRVSSRKSTEHLLVVFGSDHGLCGNYNEALSRVVFEHCRTRASKDLRLFCIGQKMSDALGELGLIPEAVLLPPASADGIGRVAGDIVTRIDAIDREQQTMATDVTLAYTKRGDHGDREAVTRQLLPLEEEMLKPAERWHSRSLPDYSMSPQALLAALLRSYIFVSVFRASAEAMVTENAARLALMQQAEKSVDERTEEVRGELRSVRQTEITNELMDVIIGFEALKERQ